MSYSPLMSSEERDAWLEGLTPSQKALVEIPAGWKYTLVLVAEAKRALQADDLPSEHRLFLLEKINSLADGAWFTKEMLAAIRPMSAVGGEMYRTVLRLVRGKGGASVALDLIAEVETFDLFCKDNPSMLEALDLRHRRDRSQEKSFATSTNNSYATA